MILLKQGEIVLKGLNRKHFESKLISNIRKKLDPFGEYNLYTAQSTIYIEPKTPTSAWDETGAFNEMQTVFGIASVVKAIECPKDRDAIYETARTYLKPQLQSAKTFKVDSKRADKSFPMTSIQLSQYVGGKLHDDYTNLTVDVHNPQLTVKLEVRDYAAFVHTQAVQGAGGMPVGSNGRAVTLLSGGLDSPISTYMIAKRGIKLIPVHFFSFPYTSQQAKEKVLDLAKILTRWCGGMMVEVVPFTRIQEEIRQKCPEALFTIIMRRFMMRISEQIADANGCKALITGENLGQVASQTMEAMGVTQQCVSLPVLRPLVGMDKVDIIHMAQRLGTYDTSILPYEDCCTVFTPRHPRTKPRLSEVLEAEAKLDGESLIAEACAAIERIRL